MHKIKKRKSIKEINAGSMADIAFLLLIFFLVTTSINAEKGITVKLPPLSDEVGIIIDRNVLSIKINLHNQLLVEGEPAELDLLRERTKNFIDNPQQLPDLPQDPTSAIISIQNDRGTDYEAYIAVYNEVKGAYHELWDSKSQQLFQKKYEDLSKSQKKKIQTLIPLIISESEPTNFENK